MNNPYQSPETTDLSMTTNQVATWVVAPAWRRVLAFFINRVLLLLPLLPFVIYINTGGHAYEITSINDDPTLKLLFWSGCVAQDVLLAVQVWMMSRYGQSIGKKILNIRVLHESGDKAGFFRVVVLRYLVPLLILIFLYGVLLQLLQYVYWVWYLVLFLGLRRSVENKRQTWQDVLASTMVVHVKK